MTNVGRAWIDVPVIIHHRCRRVVQEEDSDLIWARQRLNLEQTEIKPTTEYKSGYTRVVRSSAGAPDWICNVHLCKESDYKHSDGL